MVLNFKAKTGVADKLLAVFYSNLLFPLRLVWVALFLFLLSTADLLRFLRSGQILWFFAACGLVVLHTLFWVVLVNAAIVGWKALFGKFRMDDLEQEVTVDDEGITSVTAEGETRTALKNVVCYAETPRRLFFFRSGGQAQAFPKPPLEPEDFDALRDLFRGRVSRVIPLTARFGLPVLGVLAILVGLGFFRTAYYVHSTTGVMQAFWRDDTAVVSVPVVLTGRRVTLAGELLPLLALPRRAHPDFRTAPVTENHLFIVRDRKLRRVRMVGGGDEMLGQVIPLGNDLFLARVANRRQEFSRFDGENFLPLGEGDREALLTRLKDRRREPIGWKVFTLWDEGEDEEEDPEADQQYRATIRLKSSELLLGLDLVWTDRERYVQDRTYFLKGRDPGGAIDELLTVKGKARRVDPEEYYRLFPKDLSARTGLSSATEENGIEPYGAESSTPEPPTPTPAGETLPTPSPAAPVGTGETGAATPATETVEAEPAPATGTTPASSAPETLILQVEDEGNSLPAESATEAKP